MNPNTRSVCFAVLAASLLALFIGCGGGGGGGGGSNGGSGGGGQGSQFAYGTQVIEFKELNRVGTYVDPLNLQIGDRIQLELIGYDGVGGSTRINVTSWQISGGGGAVVLNPNTGILDVVGQPPGFFQIGCTAFVSGQPRNFVQDCLAPASTTTVSGRLVEIFSGQGVAFIQLEFLNSVGDRIGGAVTGFDGSFQGKTPTSAVAVTAKAETIKLPTFYRSLRFNSLNYTGGRSCPIPLGSLSSGQNNPMGGNISLTLQTSGPPPPPTGCGT